MIVRCQAGAPLAAISRFAHVQLQEAAEVRPGAAARGRSRRRAPTTAPARRRAPARTARSSRARVRCAPRRARGRGSGRRAGRGAQPRRRLPGPCRRSAPIGMLLAAEVANDAVLGTPGLPEVVLAPGRLFDDRQVSVRLRLWAARPSGCAALPTCRHECSPRQMDTDERIARPRPVDGPRAVRVDARSRPCEPSNDHRCATHVGDDPRSSRGEPRFGGDRRIERRARAVRSPARGRPVTDREGAELFRALAARRDQLLDRQHEQRRAIAPRRWWSGDARSARRGSTRSLRHARIDRAACRGDERADDLSVPPVSCDSAAHVEACHRGV